jgi:ribosome-binding factor A
MRSSASWKTALCYNMKINKHKKIQTEQKIHEYVSSFFRREISDKRLQHISITKVIMNADYTEAKIYWDTFDAKTRGDAMKAMKGILGKIKTHLAKSLSTRQVPKVKFFYDAQFDSERKIEEILANSAVPQDDEIDSDDENEEAE